MMGRMIGVLAGLLFTAGSAVAAEGARGVDVGPRGAREGALHMREEPIDYAELERQLQGEGLVGRIHGAVAERNLYVFTWTDPNDFFRNAQLPLIAHAPEVLSKLEESARHDKVRLKGTFMRNAPQLHIYVTGIEVLDRFDDGIDLPPYQYQTQLPQDLQDKTEIVARVHAVEAGGKALVIEWKDAVIPVFVRDTSVTAGLWRSDKIRLKYVVRSFPDRPTHLEPAPNVERPIELLEHLRPRDGEAMTLEGTLVFFPKSPQIAFNVFALQHVDADGTTLNYTLVNFTDQDAFAAIRAKLQAAWDGASSSAVAGRNKYVNPRIHVRAHGTLNVEAPAQANPQIELAGPEALEITVSD